MLSSLIFRKKRDTNTTMQVPNPSHTINPESLGLKTLASGGLGPPYPSNCVGRNLIASRSTPPPLSVDRDNRQEDDDEDDDEIEEVEVEDNSCWASYGRGHGRRFPPAIPLLARTANLSCHMPWVLKRTYRSDGSLMIQEVRVKHHEYFRAHRKNGRLTLQLVELDENSPLFASGPKCRKEKEMTTVVHSKKKRQTLPSPISSSSPTSSLSYLLKEENSTDGKGKSTNSKTTERKEVDVLPGTSPRFAMSSLMKLSSSMPEPMVPMGARKGCFVAKRGSSPLHQMPMNRMRAVLS